MVQETASRYPLRRNKAQRNVLGPMHALTIAGTGTVLPMDILGSGGRIRKDSGRRRLLKSWMENPACLICDLWRNPQRDGSKGLSRRSSIGQDLMSEQVIPLSPTHSCHHGGIPVIHTVGLFLILGRCGTPDCMRVVPHSQACMGVTPSLASNARGANNRIEAGKNAAEWASTSSSEEPGGWKRNCQRPNPE